MVLRLRVYDLDTPSVNYLVDRYQNAGLCPIVYKDAVVIETNVTLRSLALVVEIGQAFRNSSIRLTA